MATSKDECWVLNLGPRDYLNVYNLQKKLVNKRIKGEILHLYLRNLEEAIIRLLKDYGVQSKRIEGHTGVWVENEKIVAIGIGVKRWVSFHGFCLNVNPNLSYFNMINPCGIKDKGITSLAKLTILKITKMEK